MKKRILAIDDDEDILTILNIIFEDEGYEVISLNTGATVEEIQIMHPDLILLDVRIKGFHKTGDEICKEIKARNTTMDIPVILLSAEFNVSQLAQESGADGYLRKPFNVKELVDQVEQILVKKIVHR
jgi:DNA-binding response OmpR family regulator